MFENKITLKKVLNLRQIDDIMGNVRQLCLTLIILLSFIVLLNIKLVTPSGLSSRQVGGLGDVITDSKNDYLPVICPNDNLFCWLYCQVFYGGTFLGGGCCWDQKFKNQDNVLVVIQSLAKSCWCCTAPGPLALSKEAVDAFCKYISIVNGFADFLQVNDICAIESLNVTCKQVKIGTNVNLVSPGGSGSCGGDVTDIVGGVVGGSVLPGTGIPGIGLPGNGAGGTPGNGMSMSPSGGGGGNSGWTGSGNQC